jgi:type IV secretory pathway VirB4 component
MMGDEGLTTIEESLLDEAIEKAYKEMVEHDYDPAYTPTLEDIRQLLLESTEPEAVRIGRSIAIFTVGSLSLFSHKTNVNINNRLINYDISDLNDGLKSLAYLNILESIWQRVCLNRRRGINTYIVVDEAHLLFVNSFCEDYLQRSIKRWRKYGGYSDIISQNVSEMLSRPKIATLISNSSILTLLSQSPVEKTMIEEKLEISPLQLSYVTNNEKGTGIMRIDGSIIPFDIRIPKNLYLYKLITTKFNEKL